MKELRSRQAGRDTWLREHPETGSRLEALDRELDPLSEVPQIHQELGRLLAPRPESEIGFGAEHGPDLGIDIGL